MNRVVVVGGSLAGLRAAETLRSEQFDGEVVVVGAEPHRPYDRPPLSKKLLLGEWEPDRVTLRKDEVLDELDVEWRLGVAAIGLDPADHRVALADGSSLAYDGVVIATGAAPRRLPGAEAHPEIHELRTLDDSLRLRDRLLPGGRKVVVVGAGFIGLEVAAAARMLDNDVTVVEMAAAPLAGTLGDEMGSAIGRLHEAEGVHLRCGTPIEGLSDTGVSLASGESIPADVIVVGIGVTPAVDWLAGSGLDVRDGVVCDGALRALTSDGTVTSGVVAAGDVARWANPLFGEEMRVEHWTNAAEQGEHAARTLLATVAGDEPSPYAAAPFFWSDQYAHRIQFLGCAGPDDEVEMVAGDPAGGKFLTLYGRAGRLRGVLGLNAPRWVMKLRPALLERVGWNEAVAAAAAVAG